MPLTQLNVNCNHLTLTVNIQIYLGFCYKTAVPTALCSLTCCLKHSSETTGDLGKATQSSRVWAQEVKEINFWSWQLKNLQEEPSGWLNLSFENRCKSTLALSCVWLRNTLQIRGEGFENLILFFHSGIFRSFHFPESSSRVLHWDWSTNMREGERISKNTSSC